MRLSITGISQIGPFLALKYVIYFRTHRIYLVIYLFGSKLLLIFTNFTNTKVKHISSSAIRQAYIGVFVYS